jgi:imidazolonepropionase-like amidohydrolase
VAIVNATVVPMDSERTLAGQTLLVRDGVIAAIGAHEEIQIPAAAQRIDGAGRFVAPGLIDAHVHIRDESELLSYLAHGVTTVVHLSGPTGNTPDVIDLRARVNRGEIVGPTVLTAGRIIGRRPADLSSGQHHRPDT